MEDEEIELTAEVQDFLQSRSAKWSSNRPSSYSDGENQSDRSRKSSIESSTSGYDSPPHFLADHDYDSLRLREIDLNLMIIKFASAIFKRTTSSTSKKNLSSHLWTILGHRKLKNL